MGQKQPGLTYLGSHHIDEPKDTEPEIEISLGRVCILQFSVGNWSLSSGEISFRKEATISSSISTCQRFLKGLLTEREISSGRVCILRFSAGNWSHSFRKLSFRKKAMIKSPSSTAQRFLQGLCTQHQNLRFQKGQYGLQVCPSRTCLWPQSGASVSVFLIREIHN